MADPVGIKLAVRISGAHPELLSALLQVEPKQRAERLRMLASIGLGKLGSPTETTATQPTAPPSGHDAHAQRRAGLLQRLKAV